MYSLQFENFKNSNEFEKINNSVKCLTYKYLEYS
jgi:hypothetical protein